MTMDEFRELEKQRIEDEQNPKFWTTETIFLIIVGVASFTAGLILKFK